MLAKSRMLQEYSGLDNEVQPESAVSKNMFEIGERLTGLRFDAIWHSSSDGIQAKLTGVKTRLSVRMACE